MFKISFVLNVNEFIKLFNIKMMLVFWGFFLMYLRG